MLHFLTINPILFLGNTICAVRLFFLLFKKMFQIFFSVRAISLKRYNRVSKHGECICHVLPEYHEDEYEFYYYKDITCSVEENKQASRVPISGWAIIQH